MESLIKDFAGKKPMMGICLGHQAIAETFGGKLGLAKNVMHGKQSNITFETPSPIFKDIDNDVPIMRYHSIVVDQMPEGFDVTAITTDDQETWPFNIRSYQFMVCNITQRASEVQMVSRWLKIL